LAKNFVPGTTQKQKGNFSCPNIAPFVLHKRNNTNSRFFNSKLALCDIRVRQRDAAPVRTRATRTRATRTRATRTRAYTKAKRRFHLPDWCSVCAPYKLLTHIKKTRLAAKQSLQAFCSLFCSIKHFC